jgi:hypothetical protein
MSDNRGALPGSLFDAPQAVVFPGVPRPDNFSVVSSTAKAT